MPRMRPTKHERWTVAGGSEVITYPAPAAVSGRLQRPGHRLYFLTELSVPLKDRGKGYAHALIRKVTAFADSYGYDLWLYAEPFGEGGADTRALVRLYRAHGFVSVKDPEYKYEMIRRCAVAEVEEDETELETWACAWALKHGVGNFKFGAQGIPDRMFLMNNSPLWVEFKKTGEGAEPQQLYVIAQLLKQGYEVHVIDNRPEFAQVFAAAMDARGLPEEGRQVSASKIIRSLMARSRARQNKH